MPVVTPPKPQSPTPDDSQNGFGCGAVIPRPSPVLQFATALREREEADALGKTVAVTTGDVLSESPVTMGRARRDLPVISRLVRRTIADAARRLRGARPGASKGRMWIAGIALLTMGGAVIAGIGGGIWLAARRGHDPAKLAERFTQSDGPSAAAAALVQGGKAEEAARDLGPANVMKHETVPAAVAAKTAPPKVDGASAPAPAKEPAPPAKATPAKPAKPERTPVATRQGPHTSSHPYKPVAAHVSHGGKAKGHVAVGRADAGAAHGKRAAKPHPAKKPAAGTQRKASPKRAPARRH